MGDSQANAGLGTVLAGYRYWGTDNFDHVIYPKPNLQMNLGVAEHAPRLDEFDRETQTQWRATRRKTSVVDLQYQYSLLGNRLNRQNSLAEVQSEWFDYDGADRPTEFLRAQARPAAGGVATGQPGRPGRANFSQDWQLDALENWDRFEQDDIAGGTPPVDQARRHGADCRIESIEAGGNKLYAPSYDSAGNMLAGVPQSGSWNSGYRYEYDPWDRLTAVRDDQGRLLAEYDYDVLGRRTIKRTYDPGDAKTPTETRHFYYSSNWQLLEERVEQANKPLANTPPDRQYVWGMRGLDDLVFREQFNPNGTVERLYSVRDANFNVVALVDAAGQVKERYRYDAFGQFQVLDAGFAPRGASSCSWNVLFAGYYRDSETGLCLARNRVYHPTLGRWLKIDPAGVADGPNQSAYVSGNPATHAEPTGEFVSWGGMLVGGGVGAGVGGISYLTGFALGQHFL